MTSDGTTEVPFGLRLLDRVSNRADGHDHPDGNQAWGLWSLVTGQAGQVIRATPRRLLFISNPHALTIATLSWLVSLSPWSVNFRESKTVQPVL